MIVYSPMASGLLTGAMTRERIAALPDDDWRKHDPRFQEPQLSRHLALVERLRAGRRAPRHHGRGDRGRLDAAPPGGATARSSASAAPTRSSRWRSAGNLELTDDDLATIAGA